MTRSTIAIITLSIAVAVLLAIVLWPTNTAPPPIDPETYRIEERMRLRAVEVEPLRLRLDSLMNVAKVVAPTRRLSTAKKHIAVKDARVNLSDSLAGVTLIEMIETNN